MFKLIVSLLLSLCAGVLPSSAAPDSPRSIELAENWKLTSAKDLQSGGAAISLPTIRTRAGMRSIECPPPFWRRWKRTACIQISTLARTCLRAFPQDLYKQDWWYRTTFKAPDGHAVYLLDFPGINYRAEIWLNGQMVADNKHVVGMYSAHELNVTQWIKRGELNTLAVKVTPEQALQDVNGVELADSWFDWINWKYLGYQGPGRTRRTEFLLFLIVMRASGSRST